MGDGALLRGSDHVICRGAASQLGGRWGEGQVPCTALRAAGHEVFRVLPYKAHKSFLTKSEATPRLPAFGLQINKIRFTCKAKGLGARTVHIAPKQYQQHHAPVKQRISTMCVSGGSPSLAGLPLPDDVLIKGGPLLRRL